MRSIPFLSLALLLMLAGCITIDMSGAGKLPEVVKFEVSPGSIGLGDAAILSWEVSGASAVNIDPYIGKAATVGAEKVAPAASTTYTLTATNKFGTSTATAVLMVGGGAVSPVSPSGSDAGLPTITTFYASPSAVAPGSSAVLYWKAINATGAKISGLGVVAATGSAAVYPTSTTTYIIDAYNNTGGTASASTVVVVSGASAPSSGSGGPSILSFTASPSTVAYGASSTLTWSVLNATSVSISGVGTVSSTGSMIVTPAATSTLTLTAQNSSGSTYATTTITVSGSGPSFSATRPGVVSFNIIPTAINAGGNATISWNIYNATSIFIDNGIGAVGATGSTIVSPSHTTTYTLTAQNPYGTTIAAGTVAVTPVVSPAYSWPTINDFHNSGYGSGPSGGEAKLYWSVTNADTVFIDNGVGNVSASGAQKVYPTVTTTYTLLASNGGNTVALSTTVVVP